ncbi:hypothetical protein ACFQ61_15675 [Streptomyces sp. NPDC056500]|uniref:hypothetical protein n=1 Tax=Streptomyces sp. NPDC056500 TaxID=3345840 RepID=UPI00369EB631
MTTSSRDRFDPDSSRFEDLWIPLASAGSALGPRSAIDQAPAPEPGEYEVLVRHGDETTSYFYTHDPVPVVAVAGPPMVQRFNLNHVSWYIDDRLTYEARDTEVPPTLRIGMGLFTLHPLHDGRSVSLRGQGMAG